MAMAGIIAMFLLGASIATLYVDLPKAITLVFGLAAGFTAGSLIGMLFVQAALNSILNAAARPETLDDVLRSRRRKRWWWR
jgi:hypothetical protein